MELWHSNYVINVTNSAWPCGVVLKKEIECGNIVTFIPLFHCLVPLILLLPRRWWPLVPPHGAPQQVHCKVPGLLQQGPTCLSFAIPPVRLFLGHTCPTSLCSLSPLHCVPIALAPPSPIDQHKKSCNNRSLDLWKRSHPTIKPWSYILFPREGVSKDWEVWGPAFVSTVHL